MSDGLLSRARRSRGLAFESCHGYLDETVRVAGWLGNAADVLRRMPDLSIDGVLTSPPYIDSRPEVDAIPAAELTAIFAQLARVVRGPVLLNVGRVWRQGVEVLWWLEPLGLAQAAGLDLIDTRIWAKPNANPIRGRVFTDAHEYVFVLCPGHCEIDVDELRTEYAEASVGRMNRPWVAQRGVKHGKDPDRLQPSRRMHPAGARPRSYFEASVGRVKGLQHPSPMALDAARELVPVCAPVGGTVLDPLAGSGTTAVACVLSGRNCVLVEKNPVYLEEAQRRLEL